MPDHSIRIMVDESVLGLKKAFRDMPEYEVFTPDELGFPRGTEDRVLVAGTLTNDCFLLTNDFNTITETLYPPCSHGGILGLPKNKISHEYVLDRVRALEVLRLTHRAVGHFTYLEDDGIKIATHTEVIEREFRSYETLKSIMGS